MRVTSRLMRRDAATAALMSVMVLSRGMAGFGFSVSDGLSSAVGACFSEG
jgi:hypothetical protein